MCGHVPASWMKHGHVAPSRNDRATSSVRIGHQILFWYFKYRNHTHFCMKQLSISLLSVVHCKSYRSLTHQCWVFISGVRPSNIVNDVWQICELGYLEVVGMQFMCTPFAFAFLRSDESNARHTFPSSINLLCSSINECLNYKLFLVPTKKKIAQKSEPLCISKTHSTRHNLTAILKYRYRSGKSARAENFIVAQFITDSQRTGWHNVYTIFIGYFM